MMSGEAHLMAVCVLAAGRQVPSVTDTVKVLASVHLASVVLICSNWALVAARLGPRSPKESLG